MFYQIRYFDGWLCKLVMWPTQSRENVRKQYVMMKKEIMWHWVTLQQTPHEDLYDGRPRQTTKGMTSAYTLGADRHLSSDYIVISLWFLRQFVHPISTRDILIFFYKVPSNSITKKPEITLWSLLQRNLQRNHTENQRLHCDFFHKDNHKVATGYFVKELNVFFDDCVQNVATK